ncbi:aminotransferase class I/II-fold pyridoxal phosphate-dependent enzyme [Erysipelotrichaceae bacterium OttesenSCG-928-M19]|nr:aminotransferase class I/II-fold pyridoxal phosphate-dependent enzyme [Erysipelotrichaceae bacterium OttesenSCG-928-M19]
MYSFQNDYSEGAHPRILKALVESNLVQTEGYGLDPYSQQATEILKQRLGNQNVDIHFLMGGTQANIVALSAFLKPYEAVISTHEGHIYTHEAGSIEATGHKVISIYSQNGKLDVQMIDKVVKEHHGDDHMVIPRLVYISNSTELGTNYTKQELVALREYCNAHDLLLYMDGARLGAALTSTRNDVAFADLCNLFDAFYIGATKTGAFNGEAVVIVNDSLKPNFRRNIRQHGAMVAKSKTIAIQFIELFKDELYLKLASHSNKMSAMIKQGFIDAGYSLFIDSFTNQQFPIIPNQLLAKFDEKYLTSIWCPYDENHTVIRFVTSWATKEANVLELIEDMKKFKE